MTGESMINQELRVFDMYGVQYDCSVQTAQQCVFQQSHCHTGGFCHCWLQWVTQQLHIKSPHHNRAKIIPSQKALQELTAQPLPFMPSQQSFTDLTSVSITSTVVQLQAR
jgi:hypothetical protein